MTIAYTQIVILLKCVSQFEYIVWWDTSHKYIKLFGIEQQTAFANYELILLMVIFLHRAILKMFGLWKSASEYKFQEGNFLLDKCDPNTTELIKGSLMREFEASEDSIYEEKVYRTGSSDFLIVDEEKLKRKILFRHELKGVSASQEMQMKAIYKDRTECLNIREEVFTDQKGKTIIKLRQDAIRMRLQPLDAPDSSTTYPISQLVVVESAIEEPLDFFPSVLLMSIKTYVYMIRNFLDMFNQKRAITCRHTDVYKYMALCDFLNFLVLLFGFTEFAVSSLAVNKNFD